MSRDDPRRSGRNALPYYPRYPRDILEGTAGMPGELKCAYSLLIDVIYLHRGYAPDDPAYLAGQLGYSVRKWKAIRAELIARGKIIADERGFISNTRAVLELEIQRLSQDQKAENRAGSKKNSALQKRPTTEPEPEPEPEEIRSGGGSAAADEPTLRERLLAAIGVKPGQIDMRGRALGNRSDMAEVERWQRDLGFTDDELVEIIGEIAKAKTSGPPSTFSYFTTALRREAGRREAAQTKLVPIKHEEPPHGAGDRPARQRPGGRPDPADALVVGFSRAADRYGGGG